MPRTFDLLKAQLLAMGLSEGAGGAAMRLVASQPFETDVLPSGTPTLLEVPVGVSKILIHYIRVTMLEASGDFEVEILSDPGSGLIEYASNIATGELYDIVEIPYICQGENGVVYVRITPQTSAKFAVRIRGLLLE